MCAETTRIACYHFLQMLVIGNRTTTSTRKLPACVQCTSTNSDKNSALARGYQCIELICLCCHSRQYYHLSMRDCRFCRSEVESTALTSKLLSRILTANHSNHRHPISCHLYSTEWLKLYSFPEHCEDQSSHKLSALGCWTRSTRTLGFQVQQP